MRLRVVGEIAGRSRADDRGRGGRGDPHHDRCADARRRRRDRDGRAHACRRRRGRHRRGGDARRSRAPRRRRPRSRASRCSSAGTMLTPAHLGVLASLDVAEVWCHPRPRVGVCSTGDELVERGPLAPGHDPRLEPADAARGARGSGLRSGRLRHRARRRSGSLTAAITTAVDECDALVTSGAVSMGDYDFVKVVLERLASERPQSTYAWMQVAIKPAKPLAFAAIGRRAGVRSARQSGVVAGQLRAVRPPGAAASSPAAPKSLAEPVTAVAASAFRRRRRRQAAPRPGAGAIRGRAATCASAPACRRATCSRAWPRPTAWPCSRTARVSRPATTVPVILL